MKNYTALANKKAMAVFLVALVLIVGCFTFPRTPKLSGTYASDSKTITLKPSYTITFHNPTTLTFRDNTVVGAIRDSVALQPKEFAAHYEAYGNSITFSWMWGSDIETTQTKSFEIEKGGSILHGTDGEIFRKQAAQ